MKDQDSWSQKTGCWKSLVFRRLGFGRLGVQGILRLSRQIGTRKDLVDQRTRQESGGEVRGLYTPFYEPRKHCQLRAILAQPCDVYSVVSRHVAKQSKPTHALEAIVDDWLTFCETHMLVTRGRVVDSLAGRENLGTWSFAFRLVYGGCAMCC